MPEPVIPAGPGTPAAPIAPAGGGTPATAPPAPQAIPIVGDIPIITPTPEAPPTIPGQTPAPPATPGTPPGDLSPLPGETAAAYAERLKAAGVEVKRTADAQRAMHAATQRAADLQSRLDVILGRPAVGPAAASVIAPPGTPAPGAPFPAPAPSPAQPTAPPAAPVPAGLEGAVKALYARYSNSSLSEEQAFHELVAGAVEMGAAEAMRRIGSDQGLADRFYGYVTGRARSAQQAEAAGKEIETFWAEAAPNVPAELLWSYSEQAARAHPNDVPKQALFCLEKGLAVAEKIGQHSAQAQQTNEAMRRSQAATLPAGGGAPPAAPAPGAVPSFVDQMRASRANQMGA